MKNVNRNRPKLRSEKPTIVRSYPSFMVAKGTSTIAELLDSADCFRLIEHRSDTTPFKGLFNQSLTDFMNLHCLTANLFNPSPWFSGQLGGV